MCCKHEYLLSVVFRGKFLDNYAKHYNIKQSEDRLRAKPDETGYTSATKRCCGPILPRGNKHQHQAQVVHGHLMESVVNIPRG